MSKTFNLVIPFDFLLQAIAKLSPADKRRLWEFLDTDLHDSAEKPLDPDEDAEVATAYAEYQSGDFVTLKTAEDSFRQGWHEAMTGQTIPLAELWDGIDAE
jgi:hypothetical protein